MVHLPDVPVAIETRPIIKREFTEMGVESALIWDLGRAFHMKPSGENTLSRIYKIKNSRDTNRFFGRILPVKNRPE